MPAGPFTAQIQRALRGAGLSGAPGVFTVPGLFPDGAVSTPGIAFANDTDTGFWREGSGTVDYSANNSNRIQFGSAYLLLASLQSLSWGSTDNVASSTPDLFLARDAAQTLAQRNGTNAQTFRLYGTTANAGVDFERLNLIATGTTFDVLTSAGGAGATRPLRFGVAGAAQWFIGSTGHFNAVTDNANDIGAVGASRPRTIYAGTSIVAPAYTVGAAAGISFGPAHPASITVVNGIVTAAS